MKLKINIYLIVSLLSLPSLLFGATSNAAHLDGASIPFYFVIPFLGILFSLSFFPMIIPHMWEHHYGKISFFWGSFLIFLMVSHYDYSIVIYEVMHILALDYIPFIILLFSLFTIAGGVHLKGVLHGNPKTNLIIMIIGTFLASVIGTTGASMILIHPLIRAIKNRKYKSHIIIFFIFLVGNIGGSLTPLGDPPLFLGFLNGVDFFWTTKYLFKPMIFMSFILWTLFYVVDRYYYKKETSMETHQPFSLNQIKIEGKLNLLFLGLAVTSVLLSGLLKSNIHFEIHHIYFKLENILRDIILVSLSLFSLKITEKSIREKNNFTWGPIKEVAKIFVSIFITIVPVLSMLKSHKPGIIESIIKILFHPGGAPNEKAIFWITGLNSSILDNAPSYLIFFNALGGDADQLMTTFATSLVAISTGAVFMGALTYIGNGPNFMIKAIAEDASIKMPSFFGYIFKYSIPILIPILIVYGFLFL